VRNRLAAKSGPALDQPSRDDSPAAPARRLSWIKVLRRVPEVEPLAYPTCPGRLRISSLVTDHSFIDHIVSHLRTTGSGLFFPARTSSTPPPTMTSVCRAKADGVLYSQGLAPDE